MLQKRLEALWSFESLKRIFENSLVLLSRLFVWSFYCFPNQWFVYYYKYILHIYCIYYYILLWLKHPANTDINRSSACTYRLFIWLFLLNSFLLTWLDLHTPTTATVLPRLKVHEAKTLENAIDANRVEKVILPHCY